MGPSIKQKIYSELVYTNDSSYISLQFVGTLVTLIEVIILSHKAFNHLAIMSQSNY